MDDGCARGAKPEKQILVHSIVNELCLGQRSGEKTEAASPAAGATAGAARATWSGPVDLEGHNRLGFAETVGAEAFGRGFGRVAWPAC